jgi:alpha-L-fucosidase
LVVVFALTGPARADVIPSPANDLLSQANGGVAAQDSTAFGAPASRANDGNRDGDFFGEATDNSVSHDDGSIAGWLEVQMPASHVLNQVDVWNRTDGNLEQRLTPFEVQIFLGPTMVYTTGAMAYVQTVFIPDAEGGPGASGMVIPIPNVLGDRVRVQKDDVNFLHLAELEAYGPLIAPIPEPGSCALLAMGALGTGVYVWRRRRRSAH